MSQGVGKPQHMGGRLGEPFPLPPLKRTFLLVRKLRKLRKLPCSLRVEADGVRYQPPLLRELTRTPKPLSAPSPASHLNKSLPPGSGRNRSTTRFVIRAMGLAREAWGKQQGSNLRKL